MHNFVRAIPACPRIARQFGSRILATFRSQTEDCWDRCRDETLYAWPARRRYRSPCPAPQRPPAGSRNEGEKQMKPWLRGWGRGTPKARAPLCHRSLLQLFDLCAFDIAIRTALQVGIQIVHVVHDRLAGGEADHAFLEPTVAHRLDEFVLAERFHTLEQRRSDKPLLVCAVTAIAGGGPPRAEAVHRLRIDFVAIEHGVQRLVGRRGGRFVLCNGGTRSDQKRTKQKPDSLPSGQA